MEPRSPSEPKGARPVVTIHLAQSLDGCIAVAGAPTPLSTDEGRRRAHEARSQNDAVLVGANTVRIDDPRLTLREVPGNQPMRVVLASTLDVREDARILGRDGNVIVIGAEGRATSEARRRLEAAGARVAIVAATPEGEVSLHGALDVLQSQGVRALLVEGGSRIVTSFFRERLVDRLRIEMAMRLLGAPNTHALGGIHVTTLDAAPSLTNVEVERLGVNVFVRGDVVWP